jgi:hypothetical protein
VPKDPVTSGNAEAGVFVFVQAYVAQSGRMSGSVDYSWTGSCGIGAGHARKRRRPRDRSSGLDPYRLERVTRTKRSSAWKSLSQWLWR